MPGRAAHLPLVAGGDCARQTNWTRRRARSWRRRGWCGKGAAGWGWWCRAWWNTPWSSAGRQTPPPPLSPCVPVWSSDLSRLPRLRIYKVCTWRPQLDHPQGQATQQVEAQAPTVQQGWPLLPVNQTGTSNSVQAQDGPQLPQLSPVFQTPHWPYRAAPLRYWQSDNRTSTAVLPRLRATQTGSLARRHSRSPQALR